MMPRLTKPLFNQIENLVRNFWPVPAAPLHSDRCVGITSGMGRRGLPLHAAYDAHKGFSSPLSAHHGQGAGLTRPLWAKSTTHLSSDRSLTADK